MRTRITKKTTLLLALLFALGTLASACAEDAGSDDASSGGSAGSSDAISEQSAWDAEHLNFEDLDCETFRSMAAESEDRAEQEQLRGLYERCMERSARADARGERPGERPRTSADHCARLRAAASDASDRAARDRLVSAYRSCLQNQRSDAREAETEHCRRVRRSAAESQDRGERQRLRRIYYECMGQDVSREDDARHCLQIRRRAASTDDRELRARLVRAWYACVDQAAGEESEYADADGHCLSLRRAAAAERDPVLQRRLMNAYFNCIEAEEEDAVVCGDGTRLTCRMAEPRCERGQVAAVINHCWECVAEERCAEVLHDACTELRRLAAGTRDPERQRRLMNAYLECISESEAPDAVDCFDVRCPRGTLCRERASGPECVSTGDSDGPACTREYAPVCGSDGVTYSNACVARVSGARIAHEGECRTRPGEPAPSEACTFEYAPVCGTDGRTYGNRCEADRAGVRIAHAGECERSEPCVCPDVWQPVCGADGRTYGNRCEAECAGTSAESAGRCGGDEPSGCVCTREYAPMCGVDGETYGNACTAACEYVAISYPGECRDLGPCRALFTGWFWNSYSASCERGQVSGCDNPFPYADEATCLRSNGERPAPPEACTMEYAPVCGVDGRTYGNACAADQAGVEIDYRGACDDREEAREGSATGLPAWCLELRDLIGEADSEEERERLEEAWLRCSGNAADR